MATVTKPIALDESLNTTELSSRNVADVLAQELQAVAGAIGGIAVPSADHVSYDNSVSGLSATDVQNALDEIVSDIPTVNNGTLTIQQNGTSIGSFSANTASNVTANIKTPTADKKTATDQFTTADGGLLSKCQINLVPVQSGSGDPSPDNVRPISGHTEVDLYNVGKNLLKNSGAESGSSNGITWKKYADGSVEFSGTATANVSIVFNMTADSWYVGKGTLDLVCSVRANYNPQISGLNFQNDIYVDGVYTRTLQAGNVTYTFSGNRIAIGLSRIYISNGTVIPSGTRFYPQIEIGTSPSAYEPYLGHLYQVQIGSTVYGGTVDLVSGVMTVDRAFKTLNGTEGFTLSAQSGINPRRFMKSVSALNWDSVRSGYRNISDRFVSAEASANDPFGIFRISAYLVFADANSRFQDATEFNTWLATQYANGTPVEICYGLATPFTIQLTPQQIEALPKVNNLSTPLDGQSIDSVEYREVFVFDDVEKIVNLRVPISMLGTDESGRATASQAYASGDYFYKDGYMCKALTSISAGATLTLNTNYSQGTLADILKAIENA